MMNNELLTVSVNDLEELEVDTSFLSYGAFTTSESNVAVECVQVPNEWKDRLLMNPVDLPVPFDDPLQTVTIAQPAINGEEAMYESGEGIITESSLCPSASQPIIIVLPVYPALMPTTTPKTVVRLSIPPKYLGMPINEFTMEMEQSINDIVHESICCIQRDPWEYHPFYLRVFKYITIGRRLGYLPDDETQLTGIWESFFNFAKGQFELSKTTQLTFTGERSPYATYLLTKKVVIDGKTMPPKGNDSERQKRFREVECAAKRIRSKWLASSCFGDYIRENLQAKLDFFEECKLVAYPADCLKMNNIWSKFLSKEGFSRNTGGVRKVVKIPMEQIPLQPQLQVVAKPTSCDEKETEDKCKKSLNKLMLKIMVVPPPPSDSPIPPQPTPTASITSATISQIHASLLHDHTHVSLVTENNTIPYRKQSSSPSQITSRKVSPPVKNKSQPSAKIGTVKRRKRPKILINTSQQKDRENHIKGISSVIQKKKKLIGKLLATKKTSNAAQQMKLEKLLFQKRRTLSNASKGSGASAKSKSGTLVKPTIPSCRSSPMSTIETVKSSEIFPKNISVSVRPTTVARKCRSSSVMKKKSIFHHLKQKKNKKCKNKMQARLEMMIVSRKIQKNIKKKSTKLKDTTKADPVVDYSSGKEAAKTSSNTKTNRLKENSKRKVPTGKTIRKVDRGTRNKKARQRVRFSSPLISVDTSKKIENDSVQHIQSKPTNENEEIISFFISSSEKPELSVGLEPKKTEENGKVEKPGCKGPGRNHQMCDECGNWYDPHYIPVHKDAMHNPNRRFAECPLCHEKIAAAKLLWHHYCQYHLMKAQDVFDPYALLMVAPQPNKSRSPAAIGEPTVSTCELCGKTFSSFPTLTRHLYYVHGDGQNRDNYVQCQYCEKKFKKKDVLDDHVRRIHKGTVKSKCAQCGGRDFQSAGKLWKHLIDFHGESPSEAAAHCEVAIVVCVYCGMELLQDRQYANHVRAVHPEHLDEFLVVQKKYSSDGRLLTRAEKKRELRRQFKETGIGPNWIKKDAQRGKGKNPKCNNPESVLDAGTCEVCNKYIPKGLTRHTRLNHGIVHDDREISCVVAGCKSRFFKRTSMRVHVRTCHMDDMINHIAKQRIVKVVDKTPICTVYQCTLCRTYMHHTEEVKAHMVHFHDKIFEGFRQFSGTDITSVPTEFPCPHCLSKYPSDEEVRKHAENEHPDLCWRCPQCSKVMLEPSDLTDHFLEYHNETEETPKDGDVGGYMALKDSRKQMRGKMEKNWNLLRLKYNKIRVKCEICEQEIRLGGLNSHIERIHGVQEDLEMVCEYCTPHTVYTSVSKMRRIEWLCHLDKNHSEDGQINMEEKIELAKKVLTKVDWTTLKMLKNPNGRDKAPTARSKRARASIRARGNNEKVRRRKKKLTEHTETLEDSDVEKIENIPLKKRIRLSTKRSLKKTTENFDKQVYIEESQDEIYKNAAVDKGLVVRKASRAIQKKSIPTPASQRSIPLRVSTRKRKIPKKYEYEYGSCSDLDEVENTRSSRSISATPRRTTVRSKIKTARLTTNKTKIQDICLVEENVDKEYFSENVEQYKRLVVSLVRLTDEEISEHLNKFENITKGTQKVKHENDIIWQSKQNRQEVDGDNDDEEEWVFAGVTTRIVKVVPAVDPLSL